MVVICFLNETYFSPVAFGLDISHEKPAIPLVKHCHLINFAIFLCSVLFSSEWHFILHKAALSISERWRRVINNNP